MEEAKGRHFAIWARSHSSVGSARSLPPSGTFHHRAVTETARRRRQAVNSSCGVKGFTPYLPPSPGKHPRGQMAPPAWSGRRPRRRFKPGGGRIRLKLTFWGFTKVHANLRGAELKTLSPQGGAHGAWEVSLPEEAAPVIFNYLRRRQVSPWQPVSQVPTVTRFPPLVLTAST